MQSAKIRDLHIIERTPSVLGVGQCGRVARETAEMMGCFGEIEFLDDDSQDALGELDEYTKLVSAYKSVFVAMENPMLRMRWLDKLERIGYELSVLVRPRSYVPPSVALAGESRCGTDGGCEKGVPDRL